jgi:thioredoxin reductase
MSYDVVIVGGGPGGLAAALALGRARKKVLLCDAGPRRNTAALHLHNFVTRDGTPPTEFRRIGREQLAPYRSVEVVDARVTEIRGERGRFELRLESGAVEARRVLLCTGMIDELPELDGFRELWGASIFQCPYCHGWEVQDQAFGLLSPNAEMLEFSLLLRGWSRSVVVLTDSRYPVPPEAAARLASAGVGLDERRLARLAGRPKLEAVEFTSGAPLKLDVLFARPPQQQVALVRALGLALDSAGYVQIDPVQRETSIPGIYAAGDLVTPQQAAILAAASAMQAAAVLNHALSSELATSGGLP